VHKAYAARSGVTVELARTIVAGALRKVLAIVALEHLVHLVAVAHSGVTVERVQHTVADLNI
jgi:hypothetical protein